MSRETTARARRISRIAANRVQPRRNGPMVCGLSSSGRPAIRTIALPKASRLNRWNAVDIREAVAASNIANDIAAPDRGIKAAAERQISARAQRHVLYVVGTDIGLRITRPSENHEINLNADLVAYVLEDRDMRGSQGTHSKVVRTDRMPHQADRQLRPVVGPRNS